MPKHLKPIVDRLESIDGKLTTLTEAVLRLTKNDLPTATAGQRAPEDVPADGLEPWLDKEQVKDYLGIKDTAYYRWVKQGKLNPRGAKGRHRYFPGDIRELMEQRTYRKRG
ncbi:MAG: DNA-binding protein [Parapedobacter sp.]|nr:MAG: DNA-binding protein [Parapedobacter sp.]